MADYQQGVAIRINDTFSLSGVETNPSTVVYTIVAPDGTETVYNWPGDPEITNPGAGMFTLALGAPALAGFYSYDVDADGTVVASRRGQFSVIPNAQITELSMATGGPCSAWVSSQDVWNCCGQPMTTVDDTECPVDFSSEAYAASQVLFELSGRLHSGMCEKTVRPVCAPSCGCYQVLSRGYVVGNTWGGSQGPCDPSKILLSGYPVRQISEVLIDGVALDPTEYELVDWRWLRRKNDGVWPHHQNLSLSDTETDTWAVTYLYGQDPPIAAQMAAGQLACQLYKACANSGDCALPSGTTRVLRQGIVIEMLAFAAWGLQDGMWRTGLNLVDTFLNAFNPHHLTRRPTVWSPTARLQYPRRAGV